MICALLSTPLTDIYKHPPKFNPEENKKNIIGRFFVALPGPEYTLMLHSRSDEMALIRVIFSTLLKANVSYQMFSTFFFHCGHYRWKRIYCIWLNNRVVNNKFASIGEFLQANTVEKL